VSLERTLQIDIVVFKSNIISRETHNNNQRNKQRGLGIKISKGINRLGRKVKNASNKLGQKASNVFKKLDKGMNSVDNVVGNAIERGAKITTSHSKEWWIHQRIETRCNHRRDDLLQFE
jgi:hypothetical protein